MKQMMTVNFFERAICTGRIINTGNAITAISVHMSIVLMITQKMN